MLFKLTRLSTCISCLLVKMNVLNFQYFFILPCLTDHFSCEREEYKSFRPQVDLPQVVSPPSRFAPSRFAPKTTEGKLSNIIYFPYRFTAWTFLLCNSCERKSQRSFKLYREDFDVLSTHSLASQLKWNASLLNASHTYSIHIWRMSNTGIESFFYL